MRQVFLVKFIMDRDEYFSREDMSDEIRISCVPIVAGPEQMVTVVLVFFMKFSDSSSPSSHQTHPHILF